MKREKLFAVIIFMLVFLMSGCGKEETEHIYDRSEYISYDMAEIKRETEITDFTVSDSGKIIVNSLSEHCLITEYNVLGEELGSNEQSTRYGYLCESDGHLFAFDYARGAIVEIQEGGDRVLTQEIVFHTIRNMVAAGDSLYVLGIPVNTDNEKEAIFLGIKEFENNGEVIYCINMESGEISTVSMLNINAEYASEDGRLFFYGWQENNFYLYEYDTDKKKVKSKLHWDTMKSANSIVVEGGYLFRLRDEGLFAISLEDGTETELASKYLLYAFYGNDMQFYRGNLYVKNLQNAICRVAFLDTTGGITALLPQMTQDEVAESGPALTPVPERDAIITVSVDSVNSIDCDLEKLRALSGFRTQLVDRPFELENTVMELMTGNEDVDIYYFSTVNALSKYCSDLELYTDLSESEIISDYVKGCLPAIEKEARLEDGSIWMLPINTTMYCTWYIPENMEKLGLTEESLETLESYMDAVQIVNKSEKYRFYNSFFLLQDMDNMYTLNYAVDSNGKINYQTEMFRWLADTLWTGWVRNSAVPSFPELVHRTDDDNDMEEDDDIHDIVVEGETSDFDRSIVAFKTNDIRAHILYSFFEERGKEYVQEQLEGWRVMSGPKIADASEKTYSHLGYYVINPYSKQKEAALEYLEAYITYNAQIMTYPQFLQEDIDTYSVWFDTSQPAFQDMYQLQKESVITRKNEMVRFDSYIDDYQSGLITLDQAIEERQRIAEMVTEE